MLIIRWRGSWAIVRGWRRTVDVVGIVYMKKKPTKRRNSLQIKTPYHPITDFIYIYHFTLDFFILFLSLHIFSLALHEYSKVMSWSNKFYFLSLSLSLLFIISFDPWRLACANRKNPLFHHQMINIIQVRDRHRATFSALSPEQGRTGHMIWS